MIKAIIFDFDGVLCESVNIKTEAFRKLFDHYPEWVDAIVDYHKKNGGISRFEKFKVIYKDMLKKDLTENELKILGEKFSEYVYDAVVEAPFVKGAFEFLETNYNKYIFFIASGTPHNEMLSIIKIKKLEKFFKEVYGSPRSKCELVNIILQENGFKKNEVVFVGDSINDYDGAHQAGISFVGRVIEGKKNPFKELDVKGLIQNMTELEMILVKH